MKLSRDRVIHIFAGLAIFTLFYLISHATPYAGDDWAFFNNTMNRGIFDSALGMFMGWEGRLLTLFGVHSIILHKSLWNVFNALMYVVLYVFSVKIVKPKFKMLHFILFITLLVTIKDNVRMEVFTWITGSVYYALPMVISVVYAWILLQTHQKKVTVLWGVLGAMCALYLPLGMENIAIATLLTTGIIGCIEYVKQRNVEKFVIVYLAFFAVGFFIWSLSPGSDIRLARMPDWQSLSAVEKVVKQLPGVLFLTFYQNKYVMLALSLALTVLVHQRINKPFKFGIMLIFLLALPILFSQSFAGFLPSSPWLDLLVDGYSVVNVIFWTVFAFTLVGVVIYFDYCDGSVYRTVYLLIAAFSSAALLMSPVLGYRLMIFTLVFLIILVLMLMQDIEFIKPLKLLLIGLLTMVTLNGLNSWYIKYSLVQQITRERLSIIQDYYQFFDLYKDGIWLPRYPIYSIHAGDIEPDDAYHMQAFKEFYNLPQSETIIFYWKESY